VDESHGLLVYSARSSACSSAIRQTGSLGAVLPPRLCCGIPGRAGKGVTRHLARSLLLDVMLGSRPAGREEDPTVFSYEEAHVKNRMGVALGEHGCIRSSRAHSSYSSSVHGMLSWCQVPPLPECL